MINNVLRVAVSHQPADHKHISPGNHTFTYIYICHLTGGAHEKCFTALWMDDILVWGLFITNVIFFIYSWGPRILITFSKNVPGFQLQISFARCFKTYEVMVTNCRKNTRKAPWRHQPQGFCPCGRSLWLVWKILSSVDILSCQLLVFIPVTPVSHQSLDPLSDQDNVSKVLLLPTPYFP